MRVSLATASNLTRTSVRQLIDGFAESLLDGSLENCCPMAYRSVLPARQLVNLNGEVMAVPRALQTNQNSGPCTVAATLLTDWGLLRTVGFCSSP